MIKTLRCLTLAIVLAAITPFSLGEERGISVVSTTGEKITQYGESYALLIGNSDYSGFWPDLPSIQHELDAVEHTLQRQGFEVTRLANLNAKQLENAYGNFIKSYGYRHDNRLLIFFSGHGHSRGDSGKGYLVPVDAPDPELDEEGFLRRALSMTRILSLAREMESNHGMFLFDSCFSGSIFKSRALPSRTGYINQLTAKPVRQFITSGSAGETVPANSVFTPAFVDALEYGLADLNRDGFVTGTELGLFLQETVSEFIPQTPQYGKINDYELSRGDFVFALNTIDEQDAKTHSMADFLTQLERKSNIQAPMLSTAASGKLRLMEKAHAEIIEYERTSSPAYEQRHQAWSYFLSVYDANIPGSDIDNVLHTNALDSLKQLDVSMRYLQKMRANFNKTQNNVASIALNKRANVWQTYLEQFAQGLSDSTQDNELREAASTQLRLIETEMDWESKSLAMEREYAQLEKNGNVSNESPDKGIKAWSQFLTTYGADNPFSMKDNLLRDGARARLNGLQSQRSTDTAITTMSADYIDATAIDDNALDQKINAYRAFLRTFAANIRDTHEDEDMLDNAQASLGILLVVQNEARALVDMQTAFSQLRQSQPLDEAELTHFLATYSTDVSVSEDDERMREWIVGQQLALREQQKDAARWAQQVIDNERAALLAAQQFVPKPEERVKPRASIAERIEQIMLSNLLMLEDMKIKFILMANSEDNFAEGVDQMVKGNFEFALAAFDRSIALKPKKNNQEFRAYAKYELGDLDGAIADFSASMSSYATSSNLFNRARLYIEQGDMESAIKDLTASLNATPDSRAYNNRAVAHAILGDLAAAERDLTAAINKKANYETAINNRGLVHEAQGSLDLALVDFEKVLEFDARHREANSNLRHLKIQLSKNGL